MNGFEHRMAGTALIGMGLLLLLSFIRAGKRNMNATLVGDFSLINVSLVELSWPLCLLSTGVDGLIFAESGYDITFPCEEDTVCFHKWKIGTGRGQYIAIVSNGEIQRDQSEEEKCTLRFKDLTAEDVGRHHCQTGSNGSSPRDSEFYRDTSLMIV